MLKTIRVAAAVIRSEDKIFAAARGYGEFKGGWEFPGGKIESGETPQEALKREIMEELETEISVGELIDTIEYDYPEFHLSMECFICTPLSSHIHLNDHLGIKWIDIKKDDSINWVPADEAIFEKLIQYQQSL